MTRLSYIVLPRLSAFASPNDLWRIFALLRECGYEGVEFNITEPLGIGPDELKRLLDEFGLVVPSFLTGEAYNDGLCLCSPQAETRARTVRRLISYLDTARQFNAVLVVGLLQGLRRDEPDPVVAQRRIVEGMKQVAAAAGSKGVELVIEPVNHLQVGFNNSVAEVLSLISAIGSPAVRPMVDTIHLNIEESSLTEPILACGQSLRHVHLCENNGGRFGTGHVDFAAVRQALEQIGYNGFASVKVYRQVDVEEAVRSSMEHLRRAGFGR
jgi:D-psicose/D-tagatose/L-ribulose 3-epimerase